jgi:hypothetical protein
MSNPIDLIDDWPSIGSGKHSELTKRHDDWIKQLAIELKKLQSELAATRLENRQLKESLIELRNAKENPTKSPSFTEIISKESSNSSTMRTIVRNVRNELKSETRIEKNIVVSGIPEVNGDEGDEVAIKELLTALSFDTTRSVIKSKRLRKKNPVEAVQSPSPPRILIEFADRETQELALKNARNLRSLAKFDKVYINRDKTDAVRKEEAKLRRERNKRNK